MKATVVAFLCLVLLVPAVGPASGATATEQRLLSTVKTTIYGAFLGGLLGLATSLVVRDGYEDDAIKWGVVLGAFGGFATGLAESEEDDLDLLSLSFPPRAVDRLEIDRSRNRMPGTFFGAPVFGGGKDGYGGQQEEGGFEEADLDAQRAQEESEEEGGREAEDRGRRLPQERGREEDQAALR